MGLFATGVTVVTLRRPSGHLWGFTVNAFTSVSLSPALVLFCVDHGIESFAVVQESEYFAVNLLSENQEEISRRFATKMGDRFEGIAYREGAHSLPLLEGCLGSLQCRALARHSYGDHTIVIGEVFQAEASGGRPLLFYRSNYPRLAGTH
jgi:flavin reductase (DIM6/NTAB) family NADH-FMN oxidoreductase RutF